MNKMLGTAAETGTLIGVLSSKGLSTNDYTNAEKEKLRNIDDNAQVNVIEQITLNGEVIQAVNKSVDIPIPTNISAFVNDAGYLTSADAPEGAGASSATPLMDGIAARGVDNGFARGDHVHPTDTSRAAASDLNNLAGRVSVVETQLGGLSIPTKLSDLDNDRSFVADRDYVHTDNNFTDELKDKLSGIDIGANKTVIDSVFSRTSTNPVQNMVISAALDSKAALDSPTLTGVPTAPTAAAGTMSGQIATTAFVSAAIDNAVTELNNIDVNVLGEMLVITDA